MAGLELAAYRQDIDHLDIVTLIEQLTAVEKHAANIKPQIKQKTDAYRQALDDQYDSIFKMVES